jgi:outer membrane protein
VEAFYAILYLQQNLAVLDEQIQALEQHLAIAQKKVQTGSATDFDVLTTSVRVAAAKGRRVEVTNLFDRQCTLFRQITGLPAAQALLLRGDFSCTPLALNLDSLIALAMRDLPEARVSRQSEISSQVRLKLVSLGQKPTLNLSLDTGFKNGYPSNLERLKGNWIAGLQLQVPLFNGWLTRYQKQEAQAALNASQAHTLDLDRQIAASVTQAISDIGAGQAKLLTTEPQVFQAEQAVAMARMRYDAGVATNLDLLDAQTALSDARLMHLKATYELKMSCYNLQKAIGYRLW